MGLDSIRCPSCKHEVSVFAPACPSCGFPVILYSSMLEDRYLDEREPLEIVASNPHTPEVILKLLLAQAEEDVLVAITRNPKAPCVILDQLTSSSNQGVLIALASAPALSERTMERLADLANPVVASVLMDNPGVPAYIRNELSQAFGLLDDDPDEERPSSDDDDDSYDYIDDDYDPHPGRAYSSATDEWYDVMEGPEGNTMYFCEENSAWLDELP